MKLLTSFFAVSLLSAQAQSPALKAFDSADAAAQAAISAAEKNDIPELKAIFGAKSKAILTSGDPQQDAQERAEFARMARSKYLLEKDPMNLHRVVLTVGSDSWPFPVPLVESNGKWSFDPDEGQLEVRARRIGANELDTIETLAGAVSAQQEYSAADHDADGILEYAEYIMSSPGKTDGLYSEKATYQLPKAFAAAEIRSGPAQSKPVAYHGYYFRVLASQGPNAHGGAHNYLVNGKHMMAGFAFVAWPAEYGVTGVHTFIVNHDGAIYEKDLGKPASNLSTPVRSYDPDKSWKPVD